MLNAGIGTDRETSPPPVNVQLFDETSQTVEQDQDDAP
jgi:hypothetical protein